MARVLAVVSQIDICINRDCIVSRPHASKLFFTSDRRDSTHDPIGYLSKFEDPRDSTGAQPFKYYC